MEVDFAFICDYANITNKVNAMGIGFDTIYAPEVPVKHSSFFLVIQIRASVVEAGEKDMKVNIIDEDGREIIPEIKGKMNIPRPASGTESIGKIAINFNNVEFPKYCSYSIHAMIEGREMVRIPFKVGITPTKDQQPAV